MPRSLALVAFQLYGNNTAQFARRRSGKKVGIGRRLVGRTVRGRLVRGAGLLAALGGASLAARQLGKKGKVNPPMAALGGAYSTGQRGSRQQRYDRFAP